MPNKYGQYGRDYAFETRHTRREVHPIWRGIGFLLMFLIPALSYLATLALLTENQTRHWVRIPTEFLARGVSDPLLFVKIGVTLIIIVILYSVMTLLSLVIWRLFGPPRYGPMDAPPN